MNDPHKISHVLSYLITLHALSQLTAGMLVGGKHSIATAKIDESLALANALPTPFDNAIAEDNAEGRAAVEALVVSLGQQEDVLQEVFDALGLSVEIPTE